MYDVKFYYGKGLTEIQNITFPVQYTDVMDGTWDTGSFEFITNSSNYKEMSENIQEGQFIKRVILKDGIIEDETYFEIDELNVEKDSTYDDDSFKVTIKYVEATKFFTNLLMPNHTFSIYNYYIENTKETTNTSLYDVLVRSIKMIGERNYKEYTGTHEIPYRVMNEHRINEELVKILKTYPSKNRTYIDSNFYDVCKENFKDISAVPYYDATNKELTYISSMGKDTNKMISIYRDNIVVSSSYNRSLSNNADVVENKAVNIYEDNESVWYPMNIPLDNYNANSEILTDPGNYVRPKGLNEGLQQYQYWYDWYLELPFNIERIEKLYLLKIGKYYDSSSSTQISGNNEWVDVSDRIVEDSIYQGLTETEKKYFSHYKRGSNRIQNVVITAGITLEDDKWAWDKSKDNNIAFTTAFAVKYKPILNTDITLVKDINKTTNKKNMVIANKNISDSDLVSQTKYELEKGFYSQYMLEIAGEYKNIFAGELVDINGFEHYGIPSKKYLIYKVDTTFDKQGSHQIIYFNEMVAKNSVLLNEENLVRISQNPSYDSLIERVFKRSDIVKVSAGLTNNKISNYDILGDSTYKRLIAWNTAMILCPQLFGQDNDYSIDDKYIRGVGLACTSYYLDDKNLIVPDLGVENLKIPTDTKFLIPTMCFFNSGNISQVVIKAMNNYIWDNKGVNEKYKLKGGSGKLEISKPSMYSDYTGYNTNIKMKIMMEEPIKYLNGKLYDDEPLDSNYQTYYPEDIDGNYYNNARTVSSYSTISFGEKDQREIFVGAYEQIFVGSNGEESQINCKVDLTDFFTSCTSSFMAEISNEQINIGHKLDKDILIFDKKVYNINSIDESRAVKTINSENYYNFVSLDKYNIFIELIDPTTGVPLIGQVGDYVQEYSIVIRGVLNTTIKNGINTSVKKVPQIVITIPAHQVGEYERIRISLSAERM